MNGYRVLSALFDHNAVRWRIMMLLFREPMSVQQLGRELHLEQSKISHALWYLRDANLVQSKRVGKKKVYSITDRANFTFLQSALEELDKLGDDDDF